MKNNKGNELPWRKAFPEHEFARNIPLRGGRVKQDLTIGELAGITDISKERLQRLEDGHEEMDEETARVLGDALDLDHRLFLPE
mgnify:CR=1 FL=1